MKTLIKKVAAIQQKLNAPKGQFNKFGKYNYRNLEDILEAVKPLLGDLVLTISDDIVAVGDRIYIKATAKISDGEHSIENTGFAREALTKKGMDDSQITGSTSSYARKYAVAGLLLCDDNKDADSQDNNHQTIDHTAIIAKYTAATQDARDNMWPGLTNDQQTAINNSFQE